ncbi:CoA-acylating methylmalonate-semialdehyde dehydrogenase [Marinospirillum insulare]|uniref:Oxidoreductase n=1 Tax=Marinospirillum insulare TaxID=217169 RepID=A0ABQ6A598_9GAMM|nr:CoA-acylating methylmalonate-semialdehyde dehydrogenase [Marinospirillum insulare]GLR65294.1 oxidoreductase [Marinospirillum insulare]
MTVRQTPMIIGGKEVISQSTDWRDVLNPATQEVVARVPFCTLDEVDAAIENANEAFKTWRNTSLAARMRIMLKFQQLVRDNAKELAALITEEHGKTLPDAEGEVGRGLEVIEHACSIPSLQISEMAENVATGVNVYTLKQPLGVGAGITAFNFPIMLPCFMFPIAIATGNTFVLKPSEQDPTSSLRLVELAHEAGLPPGVLNVIHGGPEVAQRLCEHEHIKAVSFIGSSHVGKIIYDHAGRAGKRAQCMMGAKNHAVVLPDANKNQAIDALLGSAFGAAGQRCMANPVVILVGEAREWSADIVERSKTMKVGPGTDVKVDVCPVVSPQARDRIVKLIDSGVAQGATLALDGRNPVVKGYEKGNFVGPTVFTDVTPEMDIYSQEIFGPVLCIVGVETLEEAIAYINANENGNGTSIFTASGWAAHKFQNEIDVGQVGINMPIPVPVAYFSFTGSRASRLGPLGPNGKEAVKFWTHSKTVTERWFQPDSISEGVNTTISMK